MHGISPVLTWAWTHPGEYLNRTASSDTVMRHSVEFALGAWVTSLTATSFLPWLLIRSKPLFQSRSFTYRTAENSCKQDPYAGSLIPPEQALAESIGASMRASGVFGRVVPPGSDLAPSLVAAVSVTQFYGDFRKPSQPVGKLGIHFICYEVNEGVPGCIVLDKVCAHETRMTARTPDALMAAWDVDLREIMEEINSAYSKACFTPH